MYRDGERLQGFVIAAFSLRQLLHEQESGDAALNLSLELQDRSGLEGEALRYSSGSAADSPLQLQRELSLGDRRYSLLIRPTQAFIEANSTPILGIVLAAGTLLSLMLAALLFSLASQHQRARALVLQQTADLRQREAELAAVNSRLRGVLDAATQVAIIATDLRGTIQTFNVGAERMLGYRAVDLVGRHTPELIHLPEEIVQRSRELSQRLGRQIEDFEVFVVEASLAQGHVEQEWTYIRRDGSQLPVNLMVTGVRDAQDELVGFLGIAIDITAGRQNRLALEARDRLLEKLTANVPGAIYQYQLRADGSSCFPYASAGIRTIYEVEPEAVREDAQPVFAAYPSGRSGWLAAQHPAVGRTVAALAGRLPRAPAAPGPALAAWRGFAGAAGGRQRALVWLPHRYHRAQAGRAGAARAVDHRRPDRSLQPALFPGAPGGRRFPVPGEPPRRARRW